MTGDDVDDTTAALRLADVLQQKLTALTDRLDAMEARSRDLEDGVVRMATYQGVLHVLRDTGPK